MLRVGGEHYPKELSWHLRQRSTSIYLRYYLAKFYLARSVMYIETDNCIGVQCSFHFPMLLFYNNSTMATVLSNRCCILFLLLMLIFIVNNSKARHKYAQSLKKFHNSPSAMPREFNVSVHISIMTSFNSAIRIQKVDTKFQLSFTLEGLSEGVNALAISADGMTLLSACECPFLVSFSEYLIPHSGNDGQVFIWNLLTGEQLQKIDCAFNGQISCIAWREIREAFFLGCADGSIHLYRWSAIKVCLRCTL